MPFHRYPDGRWGRWVVLAGGGCDHPGAMVGPIIADGLYPGVGVMSGDGCSGKSFDAGTSGGCGCIGSGVL